MKRLLLLFAASLLTMVTWAVPARPRTFTVQQPDGSVITLQLVGDEYFHYYRNVETGEALTLASDGSYVPLSAGDMQSRQQVGQQRRAVANVQRTQRLARRREATGPNRVGSIKPMSGMKKGLVVLVNFTDVKMKSTSTKTAFGNMFNQEGYSQNEHAGSVRDYFKDQSYGALTIDFDVVGPVQLSHNMAYYGGNNSYGNDSRPGEMAKEACKLADGLVNYKDYDWDGDGEVDQVFIIYAGCGEASGGSSDTIWPHEWTLQSATGSYLTLDGVKVNTYACTAELVGDETENMLAPIGTACHEFSHCLGFPDMYDTNYNGAFGMGPWDIMALGSYNGPSGYGDMPCGYTAYERWQAGWLTPTELTSPKTVSGMKDIGTEAEAYILYNPANRNEYLLFENRQPQKWFEYLEYFWPQAGGLLVTHVDYDAEAWIYNTVNDNPSHQRCTIVSASKKYGTLKSSGGKYFWENLPNDYQKMLFPAGASSLTETSHASCGGKWFNGTANLGHSITDITNKGGLVGFKFDGGVEDDGSRYTVTFDPGNGSCTTTSWTQTSYGESVKLPTASVTSSVTGYTFAGWSESKATGAAPARILTAESNYTPTKDVTLYAVYKSTAAAGTYTLDYNQETKLKDKTTLSYGLPVDYVAADGSKWYIKASKYSGMRINKERDASIKVPQCPSPITTIEITDDTARELSFSDQDYTGSKTHTPLATSASTIPATIDLNGKNQTTGYIYTTDGATVITKIVVNYGSVDYQTNPVTPKRYTVTFDACGGFCSTPRLTEPVSASGVTLPAATVSVAGWKFAGWATEGIAVETNKSQKVHAAGSTYQPTDNVTLYAVYVHTATDGGNYELVTTDSDDWSGDYLIGGYDGSNTYFADGRIGGSKQNGAIGQGNVLAKGVDYNEEAEYVTGASGNPYHVTLEACAGGYLLRTQDGLYNYRSVDTNGAIANGILTSANAVEAAKYPIVITLEDDGYVTMKSSTAEFCFDTAQRTTCFGFYKPSSAQDISNAIYLYRKQVGVAVQTYCSYPSGEPVTVGSLIDIIRSLTTGQTTLSELYWIIDRILQR